MWQYHNIICFHWWGFRLYSCSNFVVKLLQFKTPLLSWQVCIWLRLEESKVGYQTQECPINTCLCKELLLKLSRTVCFLLIKHTSFAVWNELCDSFHRRDTKPSISQAVTSGNIAVCHSYKRIWWITVAMHFRTSHSFPPVKSPSHTFGVN